MRRSYRAAGTFSLSLSRLDIENPPDDIHRWRRTNSIVTGLWLLAFVQSRAKKLSQNLKRPSYCLEIIASGGLGDESPNVTQSPKALRILVLR